MNSRFFVLISVLCLLSPITVFGQCNKQLKTNTSVNTDYLAAKAIVCLLSERLTVDNLQVKIGPFTKEPAKVAGPFAQRFLTFIEAVMSNEDFKNDFVKIEHDLITSEVAKTRGPRLFPDEQPQISTEVIFKGNYQLQDCTNNKEKVLIKAWLEKPDGTEISRSSINLEKPSVNGCKTEGSGTDYVPPNGSNIKDEVDRLNGISTKPNHFITKLWINRGNGGIYKKGEDLQIFFSTEKDCYLKLIYIDANDEKKIIFPVLNDPRTPLKAHIVHHLNMDKVYIIGKPYGAEMMIAVSSTSPLDNSVDRGSNSSGKIDNNLAPRYRGVEVEPKEKSLFSESWAFLTTVLK
jgi:hypothetical protein